ncbi:MAG: DUF3786 domain-containing protein [Spirochaetaceae bacterium]|jgi:hypothetical protein|nr:DUF3786 domain-containing protein [Spirochaetaceae bacterium]
MKIQEPKKDWKEAGFEHFLRIYKTLNPAQTAERCNLAFNRDKGFNIRLMGREYNVRHPDFRLIEPVSGEENESFSEKTLVLRYLCEGVWTPCKGGRLSYRETPWGETYFSNFEGRCVKRLARAFGGDIQAFNLIFENNPQLRGEKITKQTGFHFEFMSNLFFTFIIWPGDDEFPSQAQILFDDNIPGAFSAEDLAVACDAAITRLKALQAR